MSTTRDSASSRIGCCAANRESFESPMGVDTNVITGGATKTELTSTSALSTFHGFHFPFFPSGSRGVRSSAMSSFICWMAI